MPNTPASPLRRFLASFAWLIGALGRCVAEHRHQNQYSEWSHDAVLARIGAMFLRVQRAIYAFERGTKRTVSEAFLQAARDRAGAGGASRDFRPVALPRGLGWLVSWVPEVEALHGRLAELLRDPALPEVLRAAPAARQSLLSLCNMLGIAPYKTGDAAAAVLGHYSYTAGWFAEPPARRKDAGSRRRGSPPARRQDE